MKLELQRKDIVFSVLNVKVLVGAFNRDCVILTNLRFQLSSGSVCTSPYSDSDLMFRLDDSDPSADNTHPRALSCGAGHLSVPRNQERKHLKGQKPSVIIKETKRGCVRSVSSSSFVV